MVNSSTGRKALIQTVGRGLLTILLIVLVTLKFAGVIDWSWFWVFSPIWIPGGIAAIILIAMLAFFSFVKKPDQPEDS